MRRYAIGIMCGAIGGLLLVYGLWHALPSIPFWKANSSYATYTGTLVGQDLENRTITISTRGQFSDSALAQDQEIIFAYDDDTWWGSSEYEFAGDILTRKRLATASPRALPRGTRMIVVRDMLADDPFRAQDINFLRRSAI